MANKSASEADVIKAWSEFAPLGDKLSLEHYTNTDDQKVTVVLNHTSGNIVVAALGDNANQRLLDNAGVAVLDAPGTNKDAGEAAFVNNTIGTGAQAPSNAVVVKEDQTYEEALEASDKTKLQDGMPKTGDLTTEPLMSDKEKVQA